MKKHFLLLLLMLLSVAGYSHVWEIRVTQAQNGNLTWYLQSYHSVNECGIGNSGLVINGVQYPIQQIFTGSSPLTATLFAVNGTQARGSYATITTPFLGTTLSVFPYSNNACWDNLVQGTGTFTPPPPPVCTSCPITGWSNTTGVATNNGNCDPTDDILPATITVNHLSCGSITGDGKFSVVFNNTTYGPFNYSTGITTTVSLNLPYGTSNSTQLNVVDSDFPCNVQHGLTVPGGQFNGVPAAVAAITPAGNTSFCPGGSVALNAQTGTGYSYQWKQNGNNIANANSSSYTATTSGTYTVEVSANGCPVMSSPITVTVNSLPVINITANSPVNQGGTLNVSASGAVNYTWSGPNNFIAAGPGFSINDVQPVHAGTYTVVGTDANNCQGTASKSVTVSQPAGALDFTGGSDYVDIGSVLPSNNSYTREGWFYSTDASSLNNLFSTNQDPVYMPGGFLSVGQGNNYGVIVDPQPFPLNQWTHVAITYDKPSTTLRLYINGALRASTTNAPAFAGGNTHLGHHFGGSGTSAVKMDELRFWNRALCQSEIANNMNCELGLPQTGLLAYYKFNQGFVNANNSGVTTLLDASGNNKNGTLVNFALNNSSSNWVPGNISGSCATFVSPVATITPAGPTTVCGGAVTLNANTGSGYTYQWKLNGNNIANATSASYNAIASGSYTVDVTTTNGCVGKSSAVNVTINPLPNTVTLLGGGNYCPGTAGVGVFINNSQYPIRYDLIRNGNTLAQAGFGSNGVLYFGNFQAGTYTAVAIDQNTGCNGPVLGTVTITENIAPSFTACPSNIGVATTSATCNNTVNYATSATGTPAPALTYTLSGATTGGGSGNGSGASFNKGTTTVTVTATNTCGTSQCSFTVTVNDNVNPVMATKNITAYLNASGVATIAPADVNNGSSDNCGTVNLSLVGAGTTTGTICATGVEHGGSAVLTAPAGATINAITFASYGLPDGTCGNFTTSGCHSASSMSVVSNLAIGQNSVTIPASNDLFGDPCFGIGKRLYIQATYQLPSTQSLSFNCGKLGANTVTLVGKDATGNTSSATAVVTVLDTIKPALNVPAGLIVSCQASKAPAATGMATASDNCGGANVTYTDVSTQHASALNAGYYNYTITRTWKAIDGSNNSTIGVQTITVQDVTKPTINCPSAITIACDGDSSISATGMASGNDNCSPVMITRSDVSTQSANVNDNAHYNYTITRTWVAKDVTGNSNSCTQVITVEDAVAPTVTNCPASITVSCQDDNTPAALGSMTADDNCSPVAITHSDASTQDANVNNSGHYNYTITRTWTATDVTGNSNNCTQTITVQDVTKPGVEVPANVTLNCQDNNTPVGTGTATGTDNCSPVVITYSDASTQNANANNTGHYNYVITRTWTATDVTGNATSADQIITVQDVTKPGISVPANVTLNCQDDNSAGANGTATGTDNCSPVAITYSDASTQNANVNNAGHYNYVITRTWTATDVAGNATSADQIITVQDVTKPGISVPANVTLNCQDNNSTTANGTATGTDNCSPVAITYSDASTQNANVNNVGHYNYVITRTWTATDVTGNSTSADQTITVQDVTKPGISVPVNVTLNCQDDKSTGANGTATGTDNCSPVAITYSDASTQNANVNNAGHYNYVITRTWTATDVTGNSTSADQTITVQDVTAPSITCPANATVSCKTSVSDNGTATGSDNCSPVAITSSDVSTQSSTPGTSGYYNYTITRTWKATDISGNFTTCDQLITVHALNNAVVSVSPVNTINAAHQNHTIYLGYGPQSVTLASTVQDGVGNRSYSWTPISGNVSPASATTTVSPLTSTVYTVTITDATGCSVTQSMAVEVIDVRCGNKVKICHFPPGNKGNAQQLCLPASAIPAHLAHGCILGDCPGNKNGETGEGDGETHGVDALVATEVKVYPNPNTGAFTVELPVGLEQSEVVIMDMAGKVIQKKAALEGNKLQFDLGPVARGMYMLHLTNGSQTFRTRISVQ